MSVQPTATDETDLAGTFVMLRDRLTRLRVEQILNGASRRARVYGSQDIEDIVEDVVRERNPILIVSLHEIDALSRSALTLCAATGAKVLVLVDDTQRAPWERLAGIAVGGCLSTAELSEKGLCLAIERILAGEVPVSGNLIHALLSLAAGAPRDSHDHLVRMTPREQEALVLLVDGLSNKQIARQLGISLHGAKRLVANILAKLNCTNRTSAVTKALRSGLYDKVRNSRQDRQLLLQKG
ncbi:helix-turn-helix transcriptional regulator [Streptomyces swartbergensis]|uniref:HTH luxR-type domain-containing protein n=1 Tax=Streptomyces swartbergensis TaxID=487165 RepID=A0A243SB69_9ACTN|nr:LuxR C-terminal-related transcriptional regulator [Streptomyces swartbergensis]OUD04907.1 hypothetical protein CA983_01910 [Streptomyces swartbergensis]